ncbi:MAG: permease-like cell division protein FtsX [Eubacteriaceae bacterium]|nr:permease-like cell division protein FtsX [Eubacteriaceae bacterium]
MLSKINYNIKQALHQLGRNKAMGFASICAITAMMLILGLFFVITVNVNLFAEMVKTDFEQIEVFLEDDCSKAEIQDLKDTMRTQDGVTDVKFRSKKDAMKILKKRWGESGYLLDSLDENPLPNSLLITVDSLDKAKVISDYAATIDGVEDVKYYRETVDKLTKVTDFLQLTALVIMGFLIVVSIIVVSNTIKLTVFARAKEISIMSYIGATNWFIRGPFLVEGMIIGFISSLIAALITYLAYSRIVNLIGLQVLTIISSPLVPAGYLAGNLICIFLAIGISIGACGSIVSMRKFLRT